MNGFQVQTKRSKKRNVVHSLDCDIVQPVRETSCLATVDGSFQVSSFLTTYIGLVLYERHQLLTVLRLLVPYFVFKS